MTAMPPSSDSRDGSRHTSALVATPSTVHASASTLFHVHGSLFLENHATSASPVRVLNASNETDAPKRLL